MGGAAGRGRAGAGGAARGDGSRLHVARGVYWGYGGGCTANAQCDTGFCVDGVCCKTACGGGDPNDCLVCSASLGATADGVCTPRSNGAACDDGNPNTTGDVCTAGVCAGVDHCVGVICTALDECHDAGTCVDHATGACDNPAKADGTPCSLGTCQQGTCTAAPDAGTGGSGGNGTGGTSSSSSSTSSSSSGGEPAADSGCGCRTAGGEPDDGRGWMGAVGLALVLARRRRDTAGRATRR